MAYRINQLRWEIAAALMLKIALLWLLWKICFSHPLHHSVNSQSTSQHFLNALTGEHNGS